MTEGLLLAVDIGTSSVKAIFISLDGDVELRSEVKLHSFYGPSGEAEQSADDYWAALKKIVMDNPELSERVLSIGLSGHTPSVVCIDQNGRPTRPVMTWQDNRATEEADWLQREFGNPLSLVGTSLPWSASACPAKLMWLATNEPDVVKKTRWVLQPKDYLGYHLTGGAISDPWSTKGICNVKTRQPISELLTKVGWNDLIMPELHDGYDSRGGLTVAAAKELGQLRPGIPVSVGWSDAMSGMLSLGALTSECAFIITGTSAIVGISTKQPPDDGKNLYIIPNTCAPLDVVYGPTQSSGAAIAWLGKILDMDSDHVIELAASSSAKSVPTFLPYISGERAPIWRSDVRGSFVNLASVNDSADLARAVAEGISFAERHVLEVAADLIGLEITSVRLGGHASNDERWDQIRLRTLGQPIERFEDVDTTTRGCSMLAFTALGEELESAVVRLQVTCAQSAPTLVQRAYSQEGYWTYSQARGAALNLANGSLKGEVAR